MPLHLCAGVEYGEVRDAVLAQRKLTGDLQISLGSPLSDSPELLQRVFNVLSGEIAPASGKGGALILVAHGSRAEHENRVYGAASRLCRRQGCNMMLAFMNGKPDLHKVIDTCRAKGIGAVCLAPFMVAPGPKTIRTLTESSPGCWTYELERNGIGCRTVSLGLADYRDVVTAWIEAARKALNCGSQHDTLDSSCPQSSRPDPGRNSAN